jgi:hypothetical protein
MKIKNIYTKLRVGWGAGNSVFNAFGVTFDDRAKTNKYVAAANHDTEFILKVA